MTTPNNPSRVRVLVGALASTLLVMMTLALAAAPPAEAQAEPLYTVDLVLPFGSACPEGFTNVGSVGEFLTGTYCRPNGYTPISNEASCLDAALQFGDLTAWIADSGVPTCAINGFIRTVFTGMQCPAPLQNAIGAAPSGAVADWCLVPVLTLSSSSLVSAGLPTCIESDNVQNDVAASTLQVGSQYSGSDGVRYVVHTGPPTCTFNCHSGFDINCDDKLGDYCPTGLDRDTVAGVKDCLAAVAVTEEPATPESVPAIQSVPAVQSVSVAANTTLAHTGSETTLAMLGLLFVASGSVALGARRRTER